MPIGQALIVYDPGINDAAKMLLQKSIMICKTKATTLLYQVSKVSTATNTLGYDVIVVGGPNYVGKSASSIQAYMDSLNPPANARIGVFGYGSVRIDGSNQTAVNQDVLPLSARGAVTLTATVKVTSSDNMDDECQEFVIG